jgi:hypothetical protein
MVHILQIDTCLNKLEKKDILLDIFGNKWRNFMKCFDFFKCLNSKSNVIKFN